MGKPTAACPKKETNWVTNPRIGVKATTTWSGDDDMVSRRWPQSHGRGVGGGGKMQRWRRRDLWRRKSKRIGKEEANWRSARRRRTFCISQHCRRRLYLIEEDMVAGKKVLIWV